MRLPQDGHMFSARVDIKENGQNKGQGSERVLVKYLESKLMMAGPYPKICLCGSRTVEV
jgi:hypothetical protein